MIKSLSHRNLNSFYLTGCCKLMALWTTYRVCWSLRRIRVNCLFFLPSFLVWNHQFTLWFCQWGKNYFRALCIGLTKVHWRAIEKQREAKWTTSKSDMCSNILITMKPAFFNGFDFIVILYLCVTVLSCSLQEHVKMFLPLSVTAATF